MKYLILLIALSSLCVFDCTKESADSISDGFNVSGNIHNSNGPILNAKVSIDQAINWTDYTDQDGKFNISNVNEGEHALSVIKTNEDGSFVEQSYSLQVHNDLVLNSLRLPIPLILNEPTNITLSEMTLTWNATDAEDFREYKLYKHDTPGIDEKTGELIYVSTNRNDTTFTDLNLISGKDYYYRVYVMNEFGRLGGSNVSNAKALIGNLIPDGGFENVGSIYNNWHSFGGNVETFEYDDSVKVQGTYSLKGINIYPASMDMILNNPIKLGEGIVYELSGWLKASGMATGTTEWVLITTDPFCGNIVVSDARATQEPVEIEWTYRSVTFTVPEDTDIEIRFNSGFENFWIDDLRLIVKE